MTNEGDWYFLTNFTGWCRKNCTKFNAPSFCNRLQ